MGYTHYFTFKNKTKTKLAADLLEKKYQLAIKKCNKVIKYYQEIAFDYERLSGYSAHCKPGQYGGIKVNGKGNNSHEDFILREHFTDNFKQYGFHGEYNDGFHFCKTARKPYDGVVVACLIILKHYLGPFIEIGSDGEYEDWISGLELAKLATGLKRLEIPIEKPKTCKECGHSL